MALSLKGWLTYKEVTERTGLSYDSVRKYCNRGVFQRDYLGTYPMISEKSIGAYLRKRRVPKNRTA
jgi:hypothetical protein